VLLKRISIILVLCDAGCLATAANPPERKVENNIIISECDPKVLHAFACVISATVHYIFGWTRTRRSV